MKMNNRTFINLQHARLELGKTIDKRIDIQTLTDEQAQGITEAIDNFIIDLRKYWM